MFPSVFEPAVVKTILKNQFSTPDAKAKFESEWNQNVSVQTLKKYLSSSPLPQVKQCLKSWEKEL